MATECNLQLIRIKQAIRRSTVAMVRACVLRVKYASSHAHTHTLDLTSISPLDGDGRSAPLGHHHSGVFAFNYASHL